MAQVPAALTQPLLPGSLTFECVSKSENRNNIYLDRWEQSRFSRNGGAYSPPPVLSEACKGSVLFLFFLKNPVVLGFELRT
jgi:hypothetical protein